MQTQVPPPPHGYATPQTSGLAITSLICGCLGLVTGFLTGIPAIITGHMANGAIKRSGGAVTGSGMATTGLVLGYLTSILYIGLALAALVTPVIFRSLDRANMAQNTSTAKQVQMALMAYSMDNDGKYPPDLRALETDGYISAVSTLRYRESKKELDWIYFTGLEDSDPYDTILLAAPVPTKDGKRIVLFIDGSARPIPEAEFLRKTAGKPTAGP